LAKKAFITGITGQDGSYLADLLISKGYEVHGLVRKESSLNTSRVDHLQVDAFVPERKFFLYYGDLADSARLYNLINEIKPDEIYHFGGQTSGKKVLNYPNTPATLTHSHRQAAGGDQKNRHQDKILPCVQF